MTAHWQGFVGKLTKCLILRNGQEDILGAELGKNSDLSEMIQRHCIYQNAKRKPKAITKT